MNFEDEWFILSNLLLTEQSSEPFNFKSHQLCAEPCCKALSRSFFSLLNLVLLSQVPETNQPTRTKQNFRNMLYFPQVKNTTPQLGDFGATETAFASAPLFVHSWRLFREQTSEQEETGWGSSNCVELFKQWATCFVFVFFIFCFVLFFLLSIPFIIFPFLGNGLKPVLELAVVCSGGKLKKPDEIRLGSLELPLMCLFIHLRKIRLNGLICSK